MHITFGDKHTITSKIRNNFNDPNKAIIKT